MGMETFAPSADSRVGAASGLAFNLSYDEDEEGLRGSDDSLGANTAGSRDARPRRPAGAPGVSFSEYEGERHRLVGGKRLDSREAGWKQAEPARLIKPLFVCISTMET